MLLGDADKVPMVPSLGQQPQFTVTIQPPGIHFDPPAKITLPNVEGFPPGAITQIFSFLHDQGQFEAVGPATVSEDGSLVVSDSGFGIVHDQGKGIDNRKYNDSFVREIMETYYFRDDLYRDRS